MRFQIFGEVGDWDTVTADHREEKRSKKVVDWDPQAIEKERKSVSTELGNVETLQ